MPSSVDQLHTSDRFVSGKQKPASHEEIKASSSHTYMDGNDIVKVPVDFTSEDVTDHLHERCCSSTNTQVPDSTSDDCALNNNLLEYNAAQDAANDKTKKKVRFNGLLTEEIDIDFRELGFNCWTGVPKLTKVEILSEYRAICSERHIDIDDGIVNQLLKTNDGRLTEKEAIDNLSDISDVEYEDNSDIGQDVSKSDNCPVASEVIDMIEIYLETVEEPTVSNQLIGKELNGLTSPKPSSRTRLHNIVKGPVSKVIFLQGKTAEDPIDAFLLILNISIISDIVTFTNMEADRVKSKSKKDSKIKW